MTGSSPNVIRPVRLTGWKAVRARRQGRRRHRDAVRRFRHAPFPLYGMPPAWSGRRYLGGGSWGEHRRRESVHALSLAHQDGAELDSPKLVVQTERPNLARGGGDLHMIGEALWHGDARTPDDAVAWFRSAWHLDPEEQIEVLSRSAHVIAVDGTGVSFDVLRQTNRWVAFATVGEYSVTMDADRWDIEDVELWTVTDLGPYVEGHAALLRRGRRGR